MRMEIDLAALPDDVPALHRLIGELAAAREAERAEAEAEIERLRQQLAALQRARFGRRSERLPDEHLQLGLEDLGADLARAEVPLQKASSQTVRDAEAPKGRASLPHHLPCTEQVLGIGSEVCPGCGGALHPIGETTSEMLDHVPSELRVLRLRRPRYGCRACGIIHQAPAPERPITKGMATPGLLAHVLVSKPTISRSTVSPRSSPARGSGSAARRWRAGWAARLGGSSRCGCALPSRSGRQGASMPMTRCCRCSIRGGAGLGRGGSGSMPATIGPGAERRLRPWCISTAPTGGPSGQPSIWRASVACCRWMATRASRPSPPGATSCSRPAGRMGGGSSMTSIKRPARPSPPRRWPALGRFLEDGRIDLDTNTVERAIRPVTLGRKNHLFAGSAGGADRWAILASLITTAKLNQVEPQAWLTDVLTRLTEGHPMRRLDEMLPWNWRPTPP